MVVEYTGATYNSYFSVSGGTKGYRITVNKDCLITGMTVYDNGTIPTTMYITDTSLNILTTGTINNTTREVDITLSVTAGTYLVFAGHWTGVGNHNRYTTGNRLPVANEYITFTSGCEINSVATIGYGDNYMASDLVSITIQTNSIPTLTTSTATSGKTISTITTGGNITDTGGENCTERGICYSVTINPTTSDDKVSESGDFSTGSFTEDLTSLGAYTIYHFRSYALNGTGTGYGSDETFMTLSPSNPEISFNVDSNNADLSVEHNNVSLSVEQNNVEI